MRSRLPRSNLAFGSILLLLALAAAAQPASDADPGIADEIGLFLVGRRGVIECRP